MQNVGEIHGEPDLADEPGLATYLPPSTPKLKAMPLRIAY